MLVQSHRRAGDARAPVLDLLPALPAAWPSGRVTGLRTRGAFEVDLEWEGGRLRWATLRSDRGGPCVVQYGSRTLALSARAGESIRLDASLARR
jgi:alpha-L-fucosidase 2